MHQWNKKNSIEMEKRRIDPKARPDGELNTLWIPYRDRRLCRCRNRPMRMYTNPNVETRKIEYHSVSLRCRY